MQRLARNYECFDVFEYTKAERYVMDSREKCFNLILKILNIK